VYFGWHTLLNINIASEIETAINSKEFWIGLCFCPTGRSRCRTSEQSDVSEASPQREEQPAKAIR